MILRLQCPGLSDVRASHHTERNLGCLTFLYHPGFCLYAATSFLLSSVYEHCLVKLSDSFFSFFPTSELHWYMCFTQDNCVPHTFFFETRAYQLPSVIYDTYSFDSTLGSLFSTHMTVLQFLFTVGTLSFLLPCLLHLLSCYRAYYTSFLVRQD